MTRLFKTGELVFYTRPKKEEVVCIILEHIFTDESHYFNHGGVSYFKCLIKNKTETICDTWLTAISLIEKINLNQEN